MTIHNLFGLDLILHASTQDENNARTPTNSSLVPGTGNFNRFILRGDLVFTIVRLGFPLSRSVDYRSNALEEKALDVREQASKFRTGDLVESLTASSGQLDFYHLDWRLGALLHQLKE
jgi:hypothetical protein